eukprot:1508343-Prymnesium_polylepis.1
MPRHRDFGGIASAVASSRYDRHSRLTASSALASCPGDVAIAPASPFSAPAHDSAPDMRRHAHSGSTAAAGAAPGSCFGKACRQRAIEGSAGAAAGSLAASATRLKPPVLKRMPYPSAAAARQSEGSAKLSGPSSPPVAAACSTAKPCASAHCAPRPGGLSHSRSARHTLGKSSRAPYAAFACASRVPRAAGSSRTTQASASSGACEQIK